MQPTMPYMGTFEDGGGKKCESPSGVGADTVLRCVEIVWPEGWVAYTRPNFRPTFWHGSLLEDKRDPAGTLYRRNRYYDPEKGRFTQEDPIGLAGGVNLYGFADGDPVNFSDPFGLKSCPPMCYGLGSLENALRDVAEGAKEWAANVGESAAAFWGAHGADIVTVIAMTRGVGVRTGLGPKPLLGRNPIAGQGTNPRVNTDLPGGRATGKSIFRKLTKGSLPTKRDSTTVGFGEQPLTEHRFV